MKRRVLVIDDNAANLELMVYLLRAFGYETDGTQRATDGLHKARQTSYDAIVCDIQMPEMDGFAFAQGCRADDRVKDVMLVAVTALAMVGDRERILAAGFDGYISKPLDPETFVPSIESVLRTRGDGDGGNTPTGATILVVDDVAVNVEVLKGTLAPFGYRVLAASNVRDAHVLVKSQQPDLVLCDVHMPGGDGFELLAAMKADESTKEMPFMFVSSTAWQTREKQRGMALGAHAFVLRPIDPQQLLNLVREALGEPGGIDPHR